MSKTKVKEAEKIWSQIKTKVLNNVKVYLMQTKTNEILNYYSPKLNQLIRSYVRRLPYYVAEGEKDDLTTIANLELLETLKTWVPDKCADIWPLARVRVMGAMRDHIRHVTRSDPSRFYEWVTDAAYLFKAINDRADFEYNIETGVQLNQAMKVLTRRERKIVIHHTKDDLTFKSIGEKIGISESQVSRIYKASLGKIREELERDSKE
ncbi:sigma-70 family RNA polymerase sigma factor [Candidatus Margulisiibacteriota bacterium]